MKNKRRISALILAICLVFINSSAVFASNDITVYLDGEILAFDVNPRIIDGRTMVPMRKIFESLGAVVSWDEASRTVTGKKGDITVNLTIDSTVLFKNSSPVKLDVAPIIIDGRTLVPVRAIAESFDCDVNWVADTRAVEIKTGENFDKSQVKLTASEIAEKVSPSVFYIEVSDQRKNAVASGSGFFITADGVAVTNYHVIEDTYSAQITMTNGNKFNVDQVIAFDRDLDIAIIRISQTSSNGKKVVGFPNVKMADSDNIKAGQTIYALGSPAGLQNTISNGIISNINRQMDGNSFIQITAAISHGSSGGALVNEYGEVIGITSAGIEDAENIGFAIPVNMIRNFDLNVQGIPYNEFSAEDNKITLELSEENISLSAGETKEILVRAEGKGNWSIYWDTRQKNIVACEWLGWVDEQNSVCKLKITGLREGTATVKIYTSLDFVGKNITVNVTSSKNGNTQSDEYYNSSKVNVPTFTAITGVKLIEHKKFEEDDAYTYKYQSISQVKKYMEALLQRGYRLYGEEQMESCKAYYYMSPQREIICIAVADRLSEVWIYVPR